MSGAVHVAGVAALVAAGGLAALAVLAGILSLAARIWPKHWSLGGPMRRSADVKKVFRNINARGRHLRSFRRLFAAGPWTVYVARYQPGNIPEREPDAS